MRQQTDIKAGIFYCTLIVVVTLGLLLMQSDGFYLDPGVGWHLKTGEIVSSTGLVPRTDPFLYTAEPRGWVSDQWLADVLLYKLNYHLGWILTYKAVACVYLFLYFLVFHAVVANHLKSSTLATIGAIIAAKCGQIHFIFRPVFLSFICFVISYSLLLALYRSQTKRRWALNLFFQPLLFALWANLHPGFSLALALQMLFMAILGLEKIYSTRRLPIGFIALGASLVFLSGLATLVNPYGIELHKSILELGSSKYFMNLHNEWKSPVFGTIEFSFVAWPLVIVLVGHFLKLFSKSRIEFFPLISSLVFAGLTFDAVRILPFYGILVAIPLGESIREITLFSQKWFGRLDFHLIERTFGNLLKIFSHRQSFASYAFGILLAFALVSQEGQIRQYFSKPSLEGPPPRRYPYQPIEWLVDKAESVNSKLVVFAHPDFGGFIAWYGKDYVKPIIDDRNTLLGEEFVKDFYDSFYVFETGNWKKFIESSGADYFLCLKSSEVVKLIEADNLYPVVYSDDKFVIFKLK